MIRTGCGFERLRGFVLIAIYMAFFLGYTAPAIGQDAAMLEIDRAMDNYRRQVVLAPTLTPRIQSLTFTRLTP